MVAEVYANVGIVAAKIAGEDAEMDRVAAKLLTLTKAEAAKHAKSHDFSESLRVRKVRGRRGVSDRVVESTDPLAAAKEFGHVIRNEPGGPVLGYVPGMHTMSAAIRRLPEVPGD